MSVPGPIYEVTLSVDRDIVESFDAWLASHVEEMLELRGFVGARIFELDDDEHGRARRVTQYRLDSEKDLDDYLAGAAAGMRQSAIDLFGDKFEASRRILRQTEFEHGELVEAAHCLNCGDTLAGQYCANCGQRSQSRLISIWELTRDAFGDLFELDSRVWRTLIPLMVRPGKLTRDYLQGRRARFMPPFRTYLVLSLFFFIVAFFDPREDLSILFVPEAESVDGTVGETVEEAGPGEEPEAPVPPEVRDEIIAELREEGIDVGDQEELARLIEERVADADGGLSLRFSADETEPECDVDDLQSEDLPPWMRERLTPERLEVVCDRVLADDGRAFVEKLIDYVPAGLFVLLPLMALVLKMLYPLSKRYYVEHLLFVVHYHAFIFLILIVQILVLRLVSWTGLPESIGEAATFVIVLYIPIYLYRSIRRVYGQGHLATIPKFFLLTVAYFVGLTLILVIAVIFAAFSV